MKAIVVPTDFSASADNATKYAASLAAEHGMSITLLHVYQMPVGMMDVPVVVSAEEVRANTDKSLEDAKLSLQQQFPGTQINYESRLGDVVTEINDYVSENETFAVIVGIKEHTGFEKFIFGNTASLIIRNVSAPVITVAANNIYRQVKNVVLATDLQQLESLPAKEISETVKLLGAQLHIVHIVKKATDDEYMKNQFQQLSPINPVFQTVTDDNIVHGLQTYVSDNNIDMLLVLPHKHNLYERLFFTLHTEGIVEKMPVPVLSMNALS